VRSFVVKVHLCLGLVAAFFLLILSATGAVMAFEHDIERWIDPGLWHASIGQRLIDEDRLVGLAEATFGRARAIAIQIAPRPDIVQVIRMSDGAAVFINPWDGTITRRIVGTTRTQTWIGYVHQLHLRLVPNPRATPALGPPGKVIVSIAGLMLCVLVPTGVGLWWRAKRWSIRAGGSGFRLAFDLHHALGICACLFLFVAALTGVMIGFDAAERLFYTVSQSDEPKRPKPPQASEAGGRRRISVERAIAAGRGAVPAGVVMQVLIPDTPKAVFAVSLRSPREVALDSPVPIIVYVDPYDASVVRIQDLFAESPGYYLVRLNRAIHTGDLWGFPGHVVMSLSSSALGVMVISGVIIWRGRASKKLAKGD
jgi:uncharacterized iron-regulated membrane protein